MANYKIPRHIGLNDRSAAARLSGLLLPIVALAMFCLAGCGGKKTMQGKFISTQNHMVIEFKGGKVTLTSENPGDWETGDYTLHGDKITIKTRRWGNMEFTRKPDGSLEGQNHVFREVPSTPDERPVNGPGRR